jgi:hypothetical protein
MEGKATVKRVLEEQKAKKKTAWLDGTIQASVANLTIKETGLYSAQKKVSTAVFMACQASVLIPLFSSFSLDPEID